MSIDIYSPSQARGLLRSVLQQELGRDPTDDEFDDFLIFRALNEDIDDLSAFFASQDGTVHDLSEVTDR